ncbi:hypothetical protein RRG08_005440 [Elysia crispata]|uniref:Uncharacterized protein n=1 Tax=Elysia crispata TaxID=231223 RepID=A0AAE1CR66_9GAST|nr:hypothetical protein RRG08_005440 [Elysia crispata]
MDLKEQQDSVVRDSVTHYNLVVIAMKNRGVRYACCPLQTRGNTWNWSSVCRCATRPSVMGLSADVSSAFFDTQDGTASFCRLAESVVDEQLVLMPVSRHGSWRILHVASNRNGSWRILHVASNRNDSCPVLGDNVMANDVVWARWVVHSIISLMGVWVIKPPGSVTAGTGRCGIRTLRQSQPEHVVPRLSNFRQLAPEDLWCMQTVYDPSPLINYRAELVKYGAATGEYPYPERIEALNPSS